MATYRFVFEGTVPDEYKADFEESQDVMWFKEGKWHISVRTELGNGLKLDTALHCVAIDKI